MTTQVTQCPKCNTSFRVTEAQLNIANGAVRCGSCLHIFNAGEHWLNTELAPRPRAETVDIPAVPSQQVAQTAEQTDDHSQILFKAADENDFDNIFNDEFSAEEYDFDFAEDDVQAPSQDPSILADHRQTVTQFDLQIDTEESIEINPEINPEVEPEVEPEFDTEADTEQLTDELAGLEDQSTAEVQTHTPSTELSGNDDEDRYNDDDILIGDDELISDTRSHSIINADDDLYTFDDVDDHDDAPRFSETFRNLDQNELRASAIFKDLDDMGDEGKDEDWTQKLLEDDEPETESTIFQESDQDQLEADEPPDQFSNLFDALDNEPESKIDPDLLNILNHDSEDEDADIPMDEFILGDEPMLAGERIGNHHRQLLANIEPEPVFMAAANQRNQWINRGWIAAIIIAMLLLAAQYTWFNFERLARDKNYRPALSSLCPLIGCTIPSLHNTQLIRSSNLMVRSHPKIHDALVVDAIITNRAEFPQRFPILELQFTDLEGNVIAGRRFQPEEYLAGELSGSQTMPIKQPVHIALEIVDPGQQAVNYQLYFHPQRDGENTPH